MKTAKLFVDRHLTVAEVNPNLFGGFVEHLGRCVYTGLYEPGHPEADENGFRKDVARLVADLNMPLTRYPGGNFVSGFDWKDSIGPKEKRPRKPDYAWDAMEPNEVGVDEFMKWCKLANTSPLYVVNLGTGTPKSAQECVEYCNFPGGSYWSDLRRANGAEHPHNIRWWGLGNEMDGPWQICHKNAEDYAKVAHDAAKMMKMVDPTIKVCANGSCNPGLPTFGDWDYTIMDRLFDVIDILSMHIYFNGKDDDFPFFLAAAERMDHLVESAIGCCDAAAAHHQSRRKVDIAVDEWNAWSRAKSEGNQETKWQVGRSLVEETYDLSDVLVVAGAMMSMMDHADRVKLACIAQTVNVLSLIMTRPGGPAWAQTTYYPFLLMSKHGRGGIVLRSSQEGPTFEVKKIGEVPFVRSVVIHHPDKNEVVLFAINRSLDEDTELQAELGSFQPERILEATEIYHDSIDAANTEGNEMVAPAGIPESRLSLQENRLTVTLQKHSFAMVRLAVKQ